MSRTRENRYPVYIDSNNNFFKLNLKEAFSYKDLIWLFTRKNLVKRYKQTVLGPIWLILSPVLTSIMYTIIFGTVAGINTEGMPKILFYLASNGLWMYFSEVFNRCSSTFSANAHIFGKVYFPRLVIPISNILLTLIEFLIQFLILIALCIWYSLHGLSIPYGTWLWIPVILVWLGLLAMGLGIMVSSFTTKYRDLRILVSFGLRLWMYGTPIVYPLSTLKNGLLREGVLINPATAPVELFRHFVLGIGGVPMNSIIISLVFTLVSLLAGIVIFNRVERNFMDTI